MIKISLKMAKKSLISSIFASFFLIFLVSGCNKSGTDANAKSEEEQILAYGAANNLSLTKDPSGLYYQIIKPGSGAKPRSTSIVTAAYLGTFLDKKEFESRDVPVEFSLSGVIPGWTIALQLIAPGGEMKVLIPSSLGYGVNGNRSIPGATPLYFEIKLATIKSY